jgi:phosphoglycerol transferase MdoB-like AlkP superfamily enzyme
MPESSSRATPSVPPRRMSRLIAAILSRRHGGLLIFFTVFLAVNLATRLALLVKSAGDVTWGPSLIAAFGWGLVYDLGTAAFAALPLIVLLTLLPAGWGQRAWQRGFVHLVGFGIIFTLLFGAVSEWTFWDEFGVRFNFIAVDYLIYTTEVIGNIRESYNMPMILAGVAAGALLLSGLVMATGWPARWLTGAKETARRRYPAGILVFVAALVVGSLLNERQLPAFANNYDRELAKNGLWSFFAAFRNNELKYPSFYTTLPADVAFTRLHQELSADQAAPVTDVLHDTLRFVSNPGPEQRLNVIQITVESLSASFLGTYTPGSTITPHLDALVAKSLVFDNFYATGTRTVRGMEAMTLSLPPTPGRSIVKRPRNADMFSLGSVFRSKGYDTAFIYSGYGYFDNMNEFFGNNGYRIVDRTSVKKEDITFANAWGACDEDLFNWTLAEADRSAATGKPFHYFVMTTSNHRPFTYPDGRIDLPSKVSGRDGGVKYTDYAINKFLEDASKKPWFKNTVFVIVADHCASSAGKTELPVENYHIPLLIYTPGGQINPGRVPTLMSQIDFPPTLLGLLNWSYPSRFFGWDIFKHPARPRALLGNYQRLGYFDGNELTILKPVRQLSQYRYNPETYALTPLAQVDEAARDTAISYYQSAAELYEKDIYRQLTPEEIARYEPMPVTATK